MPNHYLQTLVASIALLPSAALAADSNLFEGTFANTEEVYFDHEANRPAAPWKSLRLHMENDALLIENIDAYGKAKGAPVQAKLSTDKNMQLLDDGQCKQYFRTENDGLVADHKVGDCASSVRISAVTPFAMTLELADGRVTQLRRSRPVSCWVAILKDKPKADGGEDWHFQNNVRLHDQGGRAAIGGGDTGAQPVVIRMRNVTWDVGSTNNPVVSLYIHKPDNLERAVSYSWAAPDSARVGVNLRWVQTGCTIETLDEPSALTVDKFRG